MQFRDYSILKKKKKKKFRDYSQKNIYINKKRERERITCVDVGYMLSFDRSYVET